jgi:ATPase subunit of ABC transporter with duplicated ATPase domains
MYRPAQSDVAADASPLAGTDWESAPRVETQTAEAASNAVKAEALSVYVGKSRLLADTELKIAEHQRTIDVPGPFGESKQIKSGLCYGLVGPNGCGKSTLLRLIAEGQLPVPHTWDILFVGQQLPEPVAKDAIEEVLSGDVTRMELLKEQSSLEEDIESLAAGNAERFAQAHERLKEVQMRLSRWDGEEMEIEKVLIGLGFRRENAGKASAAPTLATPLDELSGGWRMKVQLAKALWLQPRLLLLDEPTNHLDFNALLWLEKRLQEYPHTTVIVSHDVSFLHALCSEILWVNQQRIESMPRDMVSQEDLARMQRRRNLDFHFAIPEDSPENHGVSFHGVVFDYGGSSSSKAKPLLRIPGDMRFSGTSRSVLLGKNGSGKSTFLSLCTGKVKPVRGSVDCTFECKIGHYAQQNESLDAHANETAVAYLVHECREHLEAHAGIKARVVDGRKGKATAHEKRLTEIARAVLSKFGLEGDAAVAVPTGRLSGGQKACLKFAALSLQPSHILFLDEPTNHLDPEAREALARGLSEFKGGVVVATHDYTLINKLLHGSSYGGELVICEEGTVRRDKSFGALDLKEHVRRAEEAETGAVAAKVQKGRSQGVQKPNAKKEACVKEPAASPGFLKVPINPKVPGAISTSELMKARARARAAARLNSSPNPSEIDQTKSNLAEKEKLSKDACKSEATSNEESPVVDQKGPNMLTEKSVPTRSVHLQDLDTKLSEDVAHPLQHESLMPRDGDIPDCWDDHEGDCFVNDAKEKKVDEVSSLHEAIVVSGGQFADDGASKEHAKPQDDDGKHSRFRKDLVNLNKAVARWVRQEETGSISHSELLERITKSPVVRSLRSSQGSGFREQEFIEDLISRASKHATSTLPQ